MKNFIKNWWNTPYDCMDGKTRLFDILVMSMIFLIMFFCSLIFLNAEEIDYFDLPQELVSELPEASSSTLDKVYIYDNKYYVTQEEVTGGEPEYLPLNTDLKGMKIYINQEGYAPFYACYNSGLTGNYIAWANVTSTYNTYFKYMAAGGCTASGMVDYGTFKLDINNTETICNGCTDNRRFYNFYSPRYFMEYFTLSETTIITSVINQDFYHVFSLTPWTSTTTYSWLEINEEQVFRVKPEKIYVPSDNLYCYHFVSNNILRGYVENPVVNNNVNYYDFNIDYHYRQSTGNETIIDTPVCLANTTTNYLYRNDIVEILFFAFLVGFIVIFIPIKLLLAFLHKKF